MLRITSAAFAVALLVTTMPANACWECAAGEDEGKAQVRQGVYTATKMGLRTASPEDRASKIVETVVSLQNLKTVDGRRASNVPEGTRFVKTEIVQPDLKDGGNHIYFYLDIPDSYFSDKAFSEFQVARFGSEFIQALRDEGYTGFFMMVRDPASGEFVSINDLIPEEEVQPWEPEPDYESIRMSMLAGKPAIRNLKALPQQNTMPVINPPPVTGALSGKTIFINQSHGWFDDYTWSGNRWRVQRGAGHGVLEDFDSGEFINYYVLPMLRNAGAKVMTVRESDPNTNMIIVDNSDGNSNPSNGTYAETGTWANSGINGFKQKVTASWSGVTINPFNQGSGQNRLSSSLTAGAPTATATWTANLPATGYYNVYASWSPFSARADDAQYLVRHSGGETSIRVNQTIDGYTWFLLGNFHFVAGSPASQRQVVLTNNSTDGTATNVSADAVRWGGGMGDVARHTNGVSGRPRWEEEAVIYLQFNGFGYSGTLYGGSDDEEGGWSDRPQYARWEHSQKDGSVEDAIYFAWHTNASSGGTARGFSSFRHSSATLASQNLQFILHDSVYAHVSNLWIPGWTVRSKNVTNFGENNQSSLGNGLPGVLLEGLFHDNSADAAAYNEPKFRYLLARALTQGIIDYFEARDTISLTNPPEPPVNFRAEMLGGGQVRLTWAAGPSAPGTPYHGGPATSYRVFRSSNGFGFDNGQTVAGNTVTIPGLANGVPTYFRVCAVNAGGQSFPTETLGVSEGGTKVLVVNGFDRNQASLVPTQTITNAGSNLQRDVPHTFQAFNYAIEQVNALAPTGVQISCVSNETVAGGIVNLGEYSSVFWILGEESTADETLSSAEQAAITNFLSGSGKSFFISGAEIAWDLDNLGSGADKAFFNGVLKATYVGDSANTYNVTANAGGPFAGMPTINFSTANGARYNAEFADRLGTTGGSQAALTYSGGSGGTAGVYTSSPNKIIVLGFPFETIAASGNAATFMSNTWAVFNPASAINDWSIY